jgi:transcriptional regulator with XRE-family HTH domain
MTVTRHQVRAARALLDWTQPVLAERAGIALATLKRFEKGLRQPVPATLDAIVKTLAKAGIVFTAHGRTIGVAISLINLPKDSE